LHEICAECAVWLGPVKNEWQEALKAILALIMSFIGSIVADAVKRRT